MPPKLSLGGFYLQETVEVPFGVQDIWDVAGRYSAVADDSQQAAEKREASALLAAAGGFLDAGDADEGLRTAKNALEIFRDAGDKNAMADALLLVVDALQARALRQHEKPFEALKLATDELSKFKAADRPRGQASMLLALARVNSHRQGSKNRQTGLRQGNEALKLFRDLGDQGMEAKALLAMVHVYSQARMHIEAASAADKASELYQELGDRRGEADAARWRGVAHFANDQHQEAVQSSRAALALYQELGVRRAEALEMHALAQYYLGLETNREALSVAKDAAALLQEVAFGGAAHMAALQTACQAYFANKDGETAVQYVKNQLIQCRQAGDSHAVVETLLLLSKTHLENKDADSAMARSEESLSAARENRNRRHQALALTLQAKIQLERDDFRETQFIVREATQLWNELEEPVEEGNTWHIGVKSFVKREKWDDALKMAKEAQELYQKSGDKHVEARGLLVVASLHVVQGQDSQAVSAAMEALFLFQDERDRGFQALAYHEVAGIHLNNENYPSALRQEKKALAIVKEVDNSANLAVVLTVIGNVKLGIFAQKAEDNAQKKQPYPKDLAQEVFKDLEATRSLIEKTQLAKSRPGWTKERLKLLAANWFMVAQMHMIMRAPQEAQLAIDRGIEACQEAGDQQQEALSLLLSAYVHMIDGREMEAANLADKMLTLSQEIGFEWGEFLASSVKDMIVKPGGGEGDSGAGGQENVIDPEMLKLKINDVANSLMGIESLAGDTPLMDAGLDSLSMVEFRNELVKEFPGVDLPGALLFDYPTVNALTEFVAEGISRSAGMLKG